MRGHTIADAPPAWALILAGGDGTRLRTLTAQVVGDARLAVMGVFTWAWVRRAARRGGSTLGAASLVVPLLVAPIVEAQQSRFHAPRWFRVEWEARPGPNEQQVITGSVENGYAFRVDRVQLVVEFLEARVNALGAAAPRRAS